MRIDAFVVSPIESNCYVVAEDDREGADAVIIDPGDTELGRVFDFIDGRRLHVVAVWNTHAHLDHVMGVDVVRRRYGVPAFLHPADEPLWHTLAEQTRNLLGREVPPLDPPDHALSEGQILMLGRHRFRVWHTPGHSPGSVCFVHDAVAFTGDTLFAGTIGRTDLRLSDPAAMEASLARLLEWPDQLKLYPGHMGTTTMERERRTNPFLQHGLGRR
ncbi:MAG: MBL fold metallo-hydrolase [Alicyclobacillaceae bacterium]|nr:MBL fold metallo-hydrolase [Alicyclobacillaceae bacterium]